MAYLSAADAGTGSCGSQLASGAPTAIEGIGRICEAPQPASHIDRDAKREPLWHKDNHGFWLVVCIAISFAFSFIYRAMN